MSEREIDRERGGVGRVSECLFVFQKYNHIHLKDTWETKDFSLKLESLS